MFTDKEKLETFLEYMSEDTVFSIGTDLWVKTISDENFSKLSAYQMFGGKESAKFFDPATEKARLIFNEACDTVMNFLFQHMPAKGSHTLTLKPENEKVKKQELEKLRENFEASHREFIKTALHSIHKTPIAPDKKPVEKLKGDFTYNINTGDGKFKRKEFRLTEGTDYRALFEAAFKIRGEKLERKKVLEILDLNDPKLNDPDVSLVYSALLNEKFHKKKTLEVKIANEINDVVKKVREKTGLNIKEFVNNGGNIILNI